MHILKNHWQRFSAILFYVLLPWVSFAQGVSEGPCEGSGKICNPIPKIGSLPDLVKTILDGAITIGVPIVALAIIYSGFLFVFARGKEEQLTTAKTALTYSVIGAAILLGSWAIAQMISTTVDTLK